MKTAKRKKLENYNVKMKGGNLAGATNEPVVSIVGGYHPYIWIGNNAPNDGRCFAHVSGKKTLEKFAREILKRIK